MEVIHVYPVNDLVIHETEGDQCPCYPKIEYVGNGKLVIHHSWDGRESFEMKEAKA